MSRMRRKKPASSGLCGYRFPGVGGILVGLEDVEANVWWHGADIKEGAFAILTHTP